MRQDGTRYLALVERDNMLIHTVEGGWEPKTQRAWEILHWDHPAMIADESNNWCYQCGLGAKFSRILKYIPLDEAVALLPFIEVDNSMYIPDPEEIIERQIEDHIWEWEALQKDVPKGSFKCPECKEIREGEPIAMSDHPASPVCCYECLPENLKKSYDSFEEELQGRKNERQRTDQSVGEV